MCTNRCGLSGMGSASGVHNVDGMVGAGGVRDRLTRPT